MTSDVVAVPCPRCLVQGARVVLVVDAPLEGRGCARCGGILVPAAGSERLLHDELAVSRAQLIELADSFGGRRSPCASCGARVRPLLLRGVDVDVCFHCGALWFERGALSRISGGRHVEPSPPAAGARNASGSVASLTTSTLRPLPTVRIDARSPGRMILGAFVRGVGTAALFYGWLGLPGAAGAVVAGAGLVAVGTALRWRQVVDVFPRAGRLLRSRAWMPTDPLDPRAERFDDGAVVVRALGPLAQASLVDGVGRAIAPLARGRPARVRRVARELARKLGVDVIDDGRRRERPTSPPPPPSFARVVDHIAFRAAAQMGRFAFLAGHGGERLFTVQNAVPARGDERGAERRALCFFLQDAEGRCLRLHDDERGHTVVVDGDSEAVAVVDHGGGRWGRPSCALVGSAVRVWLTPSFMAHRWLHDDRGRRIGTVRRDDDGLSVAFAPTIDSAAWFAAVVLVSDAIVVDGVD